VEIKLRWIWDDAKNKANKLKHGLSFETAQLVFNDPLAASRRAPYPDEERWQTIGNISQVTIFVVHTWPVYAPESDEEIGRIISARKATTYERRAYEEDDF
jgi:uncharacterized DUF497 family protein